MDYLRAEYRRPDDAAGAIDVLAAAGVAKSAMELFSRRPLEAEPPLLPRRSRMSLGAVLSAIAVGGGATALMFWIQRDYPLVTGGMPIVSGWATAVVTFEMTMAGAVLGIFGMLLREAGLVAGRDPAPVPDLPEEGVVLQVRCPDSADAARAALEATAPERIETLSVAE